MSSREAGLTLVELLMAVSILSIIALAFFSLTHASLQAWSHTSDRDDITESGRAALHRMTESIRTTNWILLPFQFAHNTTSSHHVLCVAQGVDNDGDGRIDEDSYDMYHDGLKSGIPGIDDDQDGNIDEDHIWDDDEGGGYDEEGIDGKDDEGDGRIDEDWGADMNKDGEPGVAYVDDDGDGLIDEGSAADDDEDGFSDEDPIEPIVYYVDASSTPPKLVERHPDLGTSVLAENLYYEDAGHKNQGFDVTRIVMRNGTQVVRLRLRLLTETGEIAEFQTTVTARGCRLSPDWQIASLIEVPK